MCAKILSHTPGHTHPPNNTNDVILAPNIAILFDEIVPDFTVNGNVKVLVNSIHCNTLYIVCYYLQGIR